MQPIAAAVWVLAGILALVASRQGLPVYEDPSRSIDERVTVRAIKRSWVSASYGQRRQAATEAQEQLEKALENKLSTKLNRIGVRLVILRTAQRRKAS